MSCLWRNRPVKFVHFVANITNFGGLHGKRELQRKISPRRSEQSSIFQRIDLSICVRSIEWWRFECDLGIAELFVNFRKSVWPGPHKKHKGIIRPSSFCPFPIGPAAAAECGWWEKWELGSAAVDTYHCWVVAWSGKIMQKKLTTAAAGSSKAAEGEKMKKILGIWYFFTTASKA